SLLLMEHAGLEVAREVREQLTEVSGKKIVVVCGPGNNGGDGFATARFLHDWGASVHVYPVGDLSKLSGDAKINYDILAARIPKAFIHRGQFEPLLAHAECAVDALFGTGLKRAVESEAAEAIRTLNQSGKPVVANDLPSGIDGDTGK